MLDSRAAGTHASYVHRYTRYLTNLRGTESAYLGTRILPGRDKAEKHAYWGRSRALEVAVPRAPRKVTCEDAAEDDGASGSEMDEDGVPSEVGGEASEDEYNGEFSEA